MDKIDKLEEEIDVKFEHHKLKIERLHNILFGNGNIGLILKVDRLERRVSHGKETLMIFICVISTIVSVLSFLKAYVL